MSDTKNNPSAPYDVEADRKIIDAATEGPWYAAIPHDDISDYPCCPQCGGLHPKSSYPSKPIGHAHYCPVLAIQVRYAAFKASETKP